MPAIAVGTAMMATQAEMRRTSSFWRTANLRQVRLQRAREEVAHGVELLARADEVVVDVAEVVADLGMDQLVVTPGQPLDRLDERGRGLPEAEHLALEPVDALRRVHAVAGEELLLDLLDVMLEALDRREVIVDDAVEDRVQDSARAVPQPLGVGVERLTDRVQVGRPRRGGR